MIILSSLHLIYFWMYFIDDIFLIFLGSNSQLKFLITFINIISLAIKYTFIYSEQTVSFLDMQIYLSQLRYNMIISEDHILQEELNNLTRILLARAYPLHLINKNIKIAALTHNPNNLLSQKTPQTITNILPVVTSISDIGKLFTATIPKNWHTVASDITLSIIWPSKPLYQVQ